MSKMKTSDIWPKGYKLTFDYCPGNTSADETFGFIFSSSEPCIFICDVVNNHDRMLEEIVELRDFVRMVADADSASDEVKSFMVHSFVHNAKQLLAKLNQEGEE